MEKNKFAGLCADIDLELKNLSRLLEELKEKLPQLGAAPGSLEVRGVGSILHDFYNGVEKIFEHIANKVDGDIPSGADWHMQLLKRMGAEVSDRRPAVINKELGEKLSEYLSFRHLFRNIYGFELKWERCKDLAPGLEEIYNDLTGQLEVFKSFLKSL
jgi:hypothetical protein